MGKLTLPAASVISSHQLVKTVAAIGVPEKISTTSIPVKEATIIGNKAEQTSNVGIVRLGPTATDGKQPYAIAAGQIGAILTDTDLSQWWIDAENAGDGVTVIYTLN